MTVYVLALFAHVLAVVYLLGADLGRLYLARLGTLPGSEASVRLAAARGALWLGSVTNAALILILPVGASLAAALGAYRLVSVPWIVASWIVAGVWLAVSIAADEAAVRAGGGRGLEGADTITRAIIGAGNIYDGALTFLGASRTVEAWWLASKISLFGALILLSIPVRRAGFRARREAAVLATAPSDAAAAGRLGAALGSMPLPIVAGWVLILLAAWIGTAKPAWGP